MRDRALHPRLGQVLRASRLSQRALRLPNVGGAPIIVAPILVGDEVAVVPDHPGPGEEVVRRGHVAARHRARRHDLRRDPGPRAGGRRRPPGPRRPRRGLLLGRSREHPRRGRSAGTSATTRRKATTSPRSRSSCRPGPPTPRHYGSDQESIEHFMTTRAPEAIVSAREAEVVMRRRVSTRPAQARPGVPGPAGRAVPRREGRHRIGGPCKDPEESPGPTTRRTAPRHVLSAARQDRAVAAFEDLGVHRCCCRCPTSANCGRSPPRCSASSATPRTSTSREYLSTLACSSRRTTARGARPAAARPPEHGGLPY